jgi:hypothetical protein
MNRISGYQSAAALVQRLLLRLHDDESQGLHDLSFPAPRGHRPHRLCPLTGRLATAACERVSVEWLRAGDEPLESCRAHLRLLVDGRDGRPATRATPGAFVEARTFVDLPPRYAAWATTAGLPRPPAPEGPVLTFASYRPAVRVRLLSPKDGLHLLRDPETPPEQATLALAAVVDPPGADVVFYVDGVPFEVAAYPYRARWPLKPGEHVVEARVPRAGARSARVRVVVQ